MNLKPTVLMVSVLLLTGCAGSYSGEEMSLPEASEQDNSDSSMQGPIVNPEWPNLVASCEGEIADDNYYDHEIQKEGTELVVVANGLEANPFLRCLGDVMATGAPGEDLGSFLYNSGLSEGEWDEDGELGFHRVQYGDLYVSANRTSENTFVLRVTLTP